jgi:hypothetical protein
VSLSLFIALLLQAAAPLSAPERFFVGRTEGVGTVQVIMSSRHGVRVHTRGRMDRDGALLLDQVVDEDGKPPRRRQWRLVRNGPNRFSGTISDARGPVTGQVNGNVLRLSYRSAEGPTVEHVITVRPDGRSAHNLTRFRRFGLNVATVEEEIRRVD